MISIIIPCYNIRNYIEQTLHSVLSQTDCNWEIIAVDDGSTDETLDVLKEYEKMDNRIRVFHQDNNGVSSARNFGLSQATGDWIYFLDGDDIIDKELVSTLNSQGVDVDFFIFDFLEEEDGSVKRIYKTSLSGNALSRFLTQKLTITMCSFGIRRDFVSRHSLNFDNDTYYGEDREFIAKALFLRPRIKNVSKVLFHYKRRVGSAMSQQYSYSRFTSVLACERTYNALRKTPEGIKARANLAFTIVWHHKLVYDSEYDDSLLESKLHTYLEKYVKGFHFYGWGTMELFATVTGIIALNNNVLRSFLRLIKT